MFIILSTLLNNNDVIIISFLHCLKISINIYHIKSCPNKLILLDPSLAVSYYVTSMLKTYKNSCHLKEHLSLTTTKVTHEDRE